MSADEMREYCRSLSSFKIRVQVRLKSGQDVMVGRVGSVDADRFQLLSEANGVQSLNFAWVARIHNV